jgi:hypothetical protein
VELNKSEFDKLIAELQKLVKCGWYIYSIRLYEVYPCPWKAVLDVHDFLNQQYSKCENMEIALCQN